MRNFLIVFGGLATFFLWIGFVVSGFKRTTNPSSREVFATIAAAASIIWFSYIMVSGI